MRLGAVGLWGGGRRGRGASPRAREHGLCAEPPASGVAGDRRWPALKPRPPSGPLPRGPSQLVGWAQA